VDVKRPAPRIDVTIDRLVLRGVPSGQRAQLLEALHTELARRLSDPAAAAGLRESRSIPVESARVAPRSGHDPAATLGVACAAQYCVRGG
jgi:hypothetical protein